jgi:5-methylcytosine-specific restriction endonuclease McrA
MPAKGQTGFKHSEETRKKISDAVKKAYYDGKIISKEQGQKISESLKLAYKEGRRQRHKSEETKLKISQSRKGKCLGNKNGFKKCQEPWNKGRPHNVHTKEWREKVSLANSGSNHWNWKGGINSSNRIMRNSTRHKEWSLAVFQRDHFSCKCCGIHGQRGKIVAHHIIPWSLNKELRFDVSNGITLCKKCHCAIHKPRTGTGKSPMPQSV